MDLAQFWFQAAGGPGPGPHQIGNSLRFRGAQQLSRTPSASGDGSTFTVSYWIKNGTNLVNGAIVFEGWLDVNSWSATSIGKTMGAQVRAGGTYFGRATNTTTIVERDPSAWYHYFWSQTGGVQTVYINGREVYTQSSMPNCMFSSQGRQTTIGMRSTGGEAMQGYMADFHFVDGTAHDPTTFGEFNADGVWVPREVDLAIPPVPNNDVAWSTYGTGAQGSYPWSAAFNEKLAAFNGVAPGEPNGSEATWTIPNGHEIPWTTLELVYNAQSNSQGTVTVNGATIATDNFVKDNAVRTLDISGMVTGDLASIVSRTVTGGAGNDFLLWILGIRVDGVLITDGGSGYGTNGFYLDFSDPDDIGADRSGNGNDFTPTGFELTDTTSTSYDWMADSPTNNYSTVSPLNINVQNVLSEANLRLDLNSSHAYKPVSTIAIPESGRFYFEGTVQGGNSQASPARHHYFGLNRSFPSNSFADELIGWVYRGSTQIFIGNGTSSGSSGSGFVNGDVLQCAVDANTGQVWMGRNNTWFRTAANPDGDPAGGTNESATMVAGTQYHSFTSLGLDSGVTGGWFVNYGQRPFAHTPPAGFEPLSTAELPNVAITNPSEHFQTILSDSDPRPDRPQPGEFVAAEGGYFGGNVIDGNMVYDLFVSPKAEGQSIQQWRLGIAGDPNAQNRVYGKANQDANLDGLHPAFAWADALTINGFNDWYIPAQDELNVIYRTLKPTTQANYTLNDPNHGANPNAFPPVGPYTSTNPAQTSSTEFRQGGTEYFAIESNGSLSDSYPTTWSSTEDPGRTGSAFRIQFGNGMETSFGDVNLEKTASFYVRAIRRREAFPIGVLERAQAEFPNGLWWIKDRANNNQHQLVDSVRGGNLALLTPSTGAETAYTAPAGNSVAWCWNLVPDRSNGFDIVTYTGNGTNQTIAHSLAAAPEFIIAGGRSNGYAFFAGSTYADNWTRKCSLNNNVFWDSSPAWNSTPPTDSVFSVGTSGTTNDSGVDYVAYLWRSVPGFSSIGSYVGNGDATWDGPFIYAGFRPAFVLLKRIDGSVGNWYIHDSERSTYNPANLQLFSDQPGAEIVNANAQLDLLSNGFKIRTGLNYVNLNASGGQYFYAAFAEHPFGGGNVSPSPAR